MALFGVKRDERPAPDPIKGDITRAVQANEMASQRAQKALEDLLDRGKMRRDLSDIVGKL